MALTPEPDLAERLTKLEESLRTLAEAPLMSTSLVPIPQFIPAAPPEPPPGTFHNAREDGLRAWLLGGLWTELLLIPRMYFDPRYRLSRITQLGVPTILFVMIANYLFFTYSLTFVPVLPPILERLVLLFLGVLLYKVLSRELARYKQVLDYLKSYGGGF